MRQPPGPLFFPPPSRHGRGGAASPHPRRAIRDAMRSDDLRPPGRVPGDGVPFVGRASDGRPWRPAGPAGPSPHISPILAARPPRRRGPNAPKERMRAAAGVVGTSATLAQAAWGSTARYRERIGRRSRRSARYADQPPLLSRGCSGGRHGAGASLQRRCGMRGFDRPEGPECTLATASIGARILLR